MIVLSISGFFTCQVKSKIKSLSIDFSFHRRLLFYTLHYLCTVSRLVRQSFNIIIRWTKCVNYDLKHVLREAKSKSAGSFFRVSHFPLLFLFVFPFSSLPRIRWPGLAKV